MGSNKLIFLSADRLSPVISDILRKERASMLAMDNNTHQENEHVVRDVAEVEEQVNSVVSQVEIPEHIQTLKASVLEVEAVEQVVEAAVEEPSTEQNGVQHQAAETETSTPVVEEISSVPTVVESVTPTDAPIAEVQPTEPIVPATNTLTHTVSSSDKIITPLIKKQLEHCSLILKGMKRHNQAPPFLNPVDPVALGIPDYPSVIKNPMDLSTIQSKIDQSLYDSADMFKDDVKLMFNNCYTYNKPDTQVYGMAKALERYFDGYFAKLPLDLTTPSVASTDDFGGKRRKSDIVSSAARPRRESAAIPPRSTSIIPAPVTSRPKRSTPELTFCMTTWKELTKKSHLTIAWPFMEPVDPIKLGIPDYFTIVKNPMDLSTVKKKLDSGAYTNGDEFEADIRLIFQNCYLYNGLESDVAKLGRELESIFDKKWASKPAPGTPSGYEEVDADAERIAQLSKQIQALQKELDDILARRPAKRAAMGKAVSSKPKTPRLSESVAPLPTTMSFEEKRQLSLDVNNLNPEKLGRVVEIIHNSMPNLQQQSDSDVIELDIESLDINTLRQLQKYVRECKQEESGALKKRKPSAKPKKASAPSDSSAPALEESLSSDDSSSDDDE